MNIGGNHTPSDAFLRVLRGLLRPLVRTMIARGLTAPVVYGLLKRVFVEVAEDSFQLDGKPLTDSRVAMLTGVHRKDIRTFRSQQDDGAAHARRKSALLATVVGQWMSHPDYTEGDAPRALPRVSDSAPDFETLVQSLSKDVRPRTVLDELRNAGLVVVEEGDMLRLKPQAVVGTSEASDKEVFFGANVGDHIAAAAENLLSDAPPFFERSVFYNQMTPDAIDVIEASARDQAQSMLEDLNRQSSALHREGKDDDTGRQRYRVGVYFYREDAAEQPEGKEQDAP
ncbi:DUF6502 family protein [uncultured Tateyamaria sp.]|uniref:DUF6502 family protein n=1 Tax=uncultured Tateyamaria sp. TaxID=455651 RepID=UPI00262E3530|nr:DUF6502 family protein [uncultured Tateyamaria sp.]